MNILIKGALLCFLSVFASSGVLLNVCYAMEAPEIKYNAGERRDPFTPLIGPDGQLSLTRSKSSTDIQIEGIILDSQGDSVVIIGEDVYRAGDTVKGANIVQIFRDRILLVQEDEEKTIWLREELARAET